MVSDNIMAELRRKSKLQPRVNAPNFTREEASRGPENERSEAYTGVKGSRKDSSLRAYYLKKYHCPNK